MDIFLPIGYAFIDKQPYLNSPILRTSFSGGICRDRFIDSGTERLEQPLQRKIMFRNKDH